MSSDVSSGTEMPLPQRASNDDDAPLWGNLYPPDRHASLDHGLDSLGDVSLPEVLAGARHQPAARCSASMALRSVRLITEFIGAKSRAACCSTHRRTSGFSRTKNRTVSD
jgi:hypothetical protein